MLSYLHIYRLHFIEARRHASRFVIPPWKRVEASNGSMDAHPGVVGLIEAHGTTGFTRGSAYTDWKSQKRIKINKGFPDVLYVGHVHEINPLL